MHDDNPIIGVLFECKVTNGRKGPYWTGLTANSLKNHAETWVS